MMKDSLLYHDLSNQEKETVFGYFLLHLLKKNELWETDHKEVYVYLAYLLMSLIDSNYQKETARYLVLYDTDLPTILDETPDLSSRYYLLKFNADHTLVECGLFKPIKDKKFYGNMDKGKIYYQMAAHCLQQIYRKETTVKRVLEHLALQFEEYQKRLQKVRKSYFHFINKLTQQEVDHLMSEVNRLFIT